MGTFRLLLSIIFVASSATTLSLMPSSMSASDNEMDLYKSYFSDAELEDLTRWSNSMGIAIEDALAQQYGLHEFEALVSELRNNYEDYIVSAYWDKGTGVLLFTLDAPSNVQDIISKENRVPIESSTVDLPNEQQQQRLAATALQAAEAHGISAT